MSKPIVTKQMLIDAKARTSQVDLFEKTFGDSVVVTVKRAEKVAALFDWDLAAQLLDAKGQAEYKRAKAPARAEYMRATAAVNARYKRATAPASAEYKRDTAAAWATAFINMHKRGKRA
jgi:hypothetical protein